MILLSVFSGFSEKKYAFHAIFYGVESVLDVSFGPLAIFLFYKEKSDTVMISHLCTASVFSSPSWARTNNPSVNSRMLYH